MPDDQPRPFRVDVDPGEIPVTVIDDEGDGPRSCLTAALHGDGLNGVKILQEVVARYRPAEVTGRSSASAS